MTFSSYIKFATLAIAGIGSASGARARSRSRAHRLRLRASARSIAGFVILAAIAVDLQAQSFVTLASFTGVGGAGPVGPLVQGTDGSFYGVTESGGTNNYGTIFKMTPAGALTTLYSFGTAATDGYFPVGGLVEGTDGNFYGVTKYNPILACCGTIFRVTPDGVFTTIHDFGLNDGTNPSAGLILGSDGNFYGTTALNGANGGATIFKVSPAGALTVLYSFTYLNQGDYALTGVVQGGGECPVDRRK